MENSAGLPSTTRRIGLWIVLAAALAYTGWLGWHWLPLGYSDKELAATVSRVWDIKHEIVEHHHLPWWTPYYMSGSSYGLNHTRCLYLIPFMVFSMFTNLMIAGKLTALLAMFLSAVTMYFCARHFMKNEWAAVLSALAFMLNPELLIRSAAQEHVTIMLFFPFIPLLWLTLALALERNTFRDTFICAVVAVLAWLADNKQAFISYLFLFAYALYWLWPRRKQWEGTARTCALLAALGLGLGAWALAPGFMESGDVKLFMGDPLLGWQKSFAFKSLLGMVDRNGVATSSATNTVMSRIQANGGHVSSQAELEQVQRVMSLTTDSTEKYIGIVLLLVIAVTLLWNVRRVDRRAVWFFVAALLATVLFSTGFSSVWSANWTTWDALSGQGVSGVALVWLLVCGAFLVLFFRRKLTSPRKMVIAGIALAIFLFVPGFQLLANLPYFKDIRAPFVFYDTPAPFWGAMLIGFFVTDVLSAEKWRAHIPKIVAGLGVLLLLDYWPYQKPTRDNGVPAHTLENLQATYSAFQQDKDWVKTYTLSGRYFHLLGPMWGGKPQVYEAFYNWMCPLGTGLLNQQAFSSWENHRAFLNLLATRYIVFDKTDPSAPSMQQILDAYRKTFPVLNESEDFVVFRNDAAHAYVTAYARACLYAGDVRKSAALALALSAKDWPLVQAKEASAREILADQQQKFERVYGEDSSPFPPVTAGTLVPLENVQLTRENSQLVRIQLTAPSPCLAVISESYYPFWHAEIDGQPTEVLRVSCGLMGLNVPAGSHTVLLRYEPPKVYALAAVVSLGTLLVGFILAVRRK